jgi:5-methylcytosine-specific restriction endonuclease McrA
MECSNCGCTETKQELNPEGSLHYGKIVCASCLKFIKHLPKPDNVDAVRRKNTKWKSMHKEKHKKFKCVCCGIDEVFYNKPELWGWQFQLDHVDPLSEGGKDEFENTQILCFKCHNYKTDVRKFMSLLKNTKEVTNV